MSGNYQSRVFTFINKRTNRFKDTCAQGFRHIKVAVIWSGQALLYPFHLLAQTTKIFQPQITPPAQKPVLPPVSDINIEQALELVVDAGYPIIIAERGSLTAAASQGKSHQQQVVTGRTSIVVSEDSSNLGYYDPDTDDWEVASYSPRRSQQQVVTKKPIIQGLSSLLVDRQLVLVTTENEILDILTSSQQQEIRRRIGIDLAIDWYQWSTGEILVGGASLFAERLPQQKENRHSPDSLPETLRERLAATQQLSLTDGHADPLLVIASSEDKLTPKLFDKLQDWFKNLTAKPKESIIQTSNFATEQLDRTESKLPRQIAPASYEFTPQPPSIERFLDLPQLPPIHEPESLAIPANSIQQTFVRLQPEWLKQWWNYYREYLSIPITGFDEFESSQIIHQPAEFQLTKIEEHRENRIEHVDRSNRSRSVSGRKSIEITHIQSRSNQNSGKLDRKIFQNVEHNPDWIETEAERVGYSRSPIAKLLEWIDRLLLQVENWLIKTWQLMTNNSNPN
jgi:hypothetical protein